MDISAEWKVMTIQSIAPDTGIEYKSEVLFKLCTPLLQLRTKKNSEMFSQDQYLLNCNLFNIHLLLYIKYAGISVGQVSGKLFEDYSNSFNLFYIDVEAIV